MTTIEIPCEDKFKAYANAVHDYLDAWGLNPFDFELELVIDKYSYRPIARLQSKPGVFDGRAYSAISLQGYELTEDMAQAQARAVALHVKHQEEIA